MSSGGMGVCRLLLLVCGPFRGGKLWVEDKTKVKAALHNQIHQIPMKELSI